MAQWNQIFKVVIAVERPQGGFNHVWVEAVNADEAYDIAANTFPFAAENSDAMVAYLTDYIPNDDTEPFARKENSDFDVCWLDGEQYGRCNHPIGYKPMNRSMRSVMETEAEDTWARAALEAAKHGRVLDTRSILSAILDGIEHRFVRFDYETNVSHPAYLRKQQPGDTEPVQPVHSQIKW